MRWLSAGAAYTLLALLACCPGRVAADETPGGTLKTSVGYHYSSGDYGSTTSTDIIYVPLIVRADVGHWRLQTSIPYLRISGPGGVVQGPDGPIQTVDGQSDGLGDILVRGSYSLLSPRWWIPFVDLEALVKFPTASQSRGLGTGEFDYGIEAELTWAAGRFTPFAMIGYRFLGSSAETPLHDVFVGDLGGQVRVTDGIHLGAFLDYRQAASASSGQRLEVIPFATFRVREQWSIDVYASAGLADGSPDAGFGFQIGYILPLSW